MRILSVIAFGVLAFTARGADLPPINEPASPDYYPGKFIWADLFTADPAAAQKFYTGLFGWTSASIERSTPAGIRHYTVLSLGDRPIAGIVLRPARMSDEVHGRWIGYVSVPDVPRALQAAVARGGRILLPARSLPRRGTQAVFTDAEGAALGVMHSSTGDPGEYLPDPGEWTWAQLFSRDPAAACAAYHAILGSDSLPDSRSNRPNEFVLTSGGFSRAAVTPLSTRPKAHPAWLLFIRVADVKEAVARAVSLGGRVLVTPSEAPTEYWRAVVADPSGAHIGLVELEDAAATRGAKP